jgi:hypothetical protein
VQALFGRWRDPAARRGAAIVVRTSPTARLLNTPLLIG